MEDGCLSYHIRLIAGALKESIRFYLPVGWGWLNEKVIEAVQHNCSTAFLHF